MQPEKFVFTGRLLQALQGLGRFNLTTPFTGAKTEAIEQAKKIGVAVAVIDAVVHGVSREGALAASITTSLERHHGKPI